MAAEEELQRLVVRLTGDASGYQRMLRQAQASTSSAAAAVTAASRAFTLVGVKLNTLGRSFRSAGQSMATFGRSMSMRVTAPILAFGGASVLAMTRFDQAMTESLSIMKVTSDQAARMRSMAIELPFSGEVIQGPKELAKSYFFLASAGKDAEQSMALLPEVAKFATAGAFDMALATDLLTDAQSALGLSSRDVATDQRNMARLADVLVKANTLANANVQQFSTALTSKAGSALKAYNKDVEEGVAVLAAMADQGIKAELAGENLSRLMLLMSKAALGNQEAMKKYNFQVFDAQGKMRNFADIIGNLEQSLSGMSDEQKAAALEALGFEARIQGAILPLLGTSQAIRRYEQELRKAAGTTQAVADKQMKSFGNQMKIVWNRVTVLAIEIGEILAPALQRVGAWISSATQWWRNLTTESKRLIVIVAAITAGIAPLLMTLGSMLSLVGLSVIGLGGLFTALGALLSPVSLVIAAVAALGYAVLFHTEAGAAALAWFSKMWGKLLDAIQPALDGIRNAIAAGDLELAFKIAWTEIKLLWVQGTQDLQEYWAAFLQVLKVAFAESVATIKTIWQNAVTWIADKMIRVGAVFTGEDVEGVLATLQEDAARAQKGIADTRVKAIEEAQQATVDTFEKLGKDLKDLKAARAALITEAEEKQLAAQTAGYAHDFAAAMEAASADVGSKIVEDAQNAIPKRGVIIPVSYEVVEAARAGTVEAASRMAQFQAGKTMAFSGTMTTAIGTPAEKDVAEGLLERIANAVEETAEKPTIEAEGMGLGI